MFGYKNKKNTFFGRNPIKVDNFAFLFNYRLMGLTSDSITVPTLKTYLEMNWLGPESLAVVRPTGVYLLDFFAQVYSFMCCCVIIFALFSFYICLFV